MSSQNYSAQVDSKYRTLLIVWMGIASSIVVYFLISLVLPATGEPVNKSLNIVFSFASAFLAVVSFAVKKSFLSRAEAEQKIQLVSTGLLLAAALCDTGAIFGMLDLVMAHNRYYFVSIILCFVGLLFHFPRRSQFQAAVYRMPESFSS